MKAARRVWCGLALGLTAVVALTAVTVGSGGWKLAVRGKDDVEYSDTISRPADQVGHGPQGPERPGPDGCALLVREELSSDTGSQTVPFTVDGEYAYYRIDVENGGHVTYQITLTDLAGKNQLASSPVKLTPGNHVAIQRASVPKGGYFLTVTAADGSHLAGSISVRVADSPRGLTAVEMNIG